MVNALAIFVAGGSLAVAGAGLALSRWDRRQEKRKRIEVHVAEVPVLPQGMRGRSEWSPAQVWWNQTKIDNPRYVCVEFRNAGRVELKESEISQAPAVEVVDGALVAACVYRVTRNPAARRLIKNIAQNGNRIDAPSLLLNPGDSLEFWLLVDGGTQPPDFDLLAGGFEVTSRDARHSVGRRGALLRNWIALSAVLVGVLVAVSSFFVH